MVDPFQFHILAVEVHYKHFCRSDAGGLEGAFVAGVCRIKVLRALGDQFLLGLVVLLDLKVTIVRGDREDRIRGERVPIHPGGFAG